MGAQSLRLLLRQTGLDQYVGNPLDPRAKPAAYASEIAALLNGIRSYYGRGARGSLNRIGRAVWRDIQADAPINRRLRALFWRLFPPAIRCRKALEALAVVMREPDGQVSVRQQDTDLIFVDESSDFTIGQQDKENLCWITVGMIQEAVAWAAHKELDVSEAACRATGAGACTFRIRLTDGAKRSAP